jgi:hypothetical protein
MDALFSRLEESVYVKVDPAASEVTMYYIWFKAMYVCFSICKSNRHSICAYRLNTAMDLMRGSHFFLFDVSQRVFSFSKE